MHIHQLRIKNTGINLYGEKMIQHVTIEPEKQLGGRSGNEHAHFFGELQAFLPHKILGVHEFRQAHDEALAVLLIEVHVKRKTAQVAVIPRHHLIGEFPAVAQANEPTCEGDERFARQVEDEKDERDDEKKNEGHAC